MRESEQDVGRDLGRAPLAADEVDGDVQVGAALGEALRERERVAGVYEHVEAPALHLVALVLVLFVEKRQLIHVASVLARVDDSCPDRFVQFGTKSATQSLGADS
jgi:hypothetical protein